MPKKTIKTIKKNKKEIRKKSVKTRLSIPVYDLDGSEKELVALPKEIFAVEVNEKLLAQYVRVYLANQRQGTASTKTRGEVIGSTRKIYKQKGTGRARHGDIKAPVFVGGGVVGGPKQRDYSLRLNKKQAKKALFNALTLSLQKGAIIGLGDEFIKIEAKTNKFAAFLKSLNLKKEKILLVLPKMERNNLVLAVRNLSNVTIIDVNSINPFEILRNGKVLIVKAGLQVLEKRFVKAGQTLK